MHNMMAPIKTLNLAELTEKYKASTKFDEIELIFIPAHAEEFYIKGNKIYINFFKLIPNYEDPKDIKIAGLVGRTRLWESMICQENGRLLQTRLKHI